MSDEDWQVALQRKTAELEAAVAELRVCNETLDHLKSMPHTTVIEVHEEITMLEKGNSALLERIAELEPCVIRNAPGAVAPSSSETSGITALSSPFDRSGTSGPSDPTAAPGPATGAGSSSAAAAAALSSRQSEALSAKLLSAARQGRVDEMRQLIEKGADVRYKDLMFGATVLHWAAQDGHVEAVRLLLARGAPVDATITFGDTPLHWAALHGHWLCVEVLAAAGADLDARDIAGNTPLHHAAIENEERTVRTLLVLGANPGMKNHEGETARDVATSDAVHDLFDL